MNLPLREIGALAAAGAPGAGGPPEYRPAVLVFLTSTAAFRATPCHPARRCHVIASARSGRARARGERGIASARGIRLPAPARAAKLRAGRDPYSRGGSAAMLRILGSRKTLCNGI